MKKQILITIIILMMMTNTFGVEITKIKKDDTWVYTDDKKNKFDEKAIELWYDDDNENGLIEVNTSRPFYFDTIHEYVFETDITNVTATFNITENVDSGTLTITAKGGIPVSSDRVFEGGLILSSTELNYTQYIDLTGKPTTRAINGEIGETIVTEEQVEFSWGMIIINDIYNYYINSIDVLKSVEKGNFTLENKENTISVEINNDNDTIDFQQFSADTEVGLSFEHKILGTANIFNGLSLSQSKINTLFLSYENNFSLPVYVAQYEPVISNGLSLSQSTKLVEYFLFQEEIEPTSSDTTKSPLIFSMVFLAILPILKNANRFK